MNLLLAGLFEEDTDSMKRQIPAEILAQHVAVLGKTGSGKTSTAKLLIEQVVSEGARVCVLDPIKSDWWGLTSSADGKRAGLPFHILGGPHGHVPLHASAGKAIGEIVANGALPLSIVDMADFEPGGQAKFFVDFAPTLLRKMRGVVYLVIEEAHLFAPKERSGIGAENLSIHWAKTLATAGRSKGVRLVLVTQRTQALHNALLGSCDTMIAHRLTAPADQEPVVKWLKANTSKQVLEQVSSSLASLKTGDAWLCSGEAKRFDVVHFSRIATYDNTATPTGDGDTRVIKTAPVDQEKLRAIIGDAVEKAKADDPRELKRLLAQASTDAAVKDKRISDLEARVSRASGSAHSSDREKPAAGKPVLTAADRALIDTLLERLRTQQEALTRNVRIDMDAIAVAATTALRAIGQEIWNRQSDGRDAFMKLLDGKQVGRLFEKLAAVRPQPMSIQTVRAPSAERRSAGATVPPRQPSRPGPSEPHGDIGTGAPARMLAVLKQFPGADARRLGAIAGVSPRLSTFRVAIARLKQGGLINGDRSGYRLTPSGEAAAANVPAAPTGAEAIDHWRRELGDGAPAKIFDALVAVYPKHLTAADVHDATGIDPGLSTFRVAMAKLRNLELVTGGRSGMAASAALFLEA
jgi:hypothetical protein